MVFLDCSWLYRTLEDKLDDIIQAKDQEMIKELVIRLLDSYAKQTDNSVDDKIVELVRAKLFNTELPEENLFGIMTSLASFLPICEYRSELISGISYIQENFNKPITEVFQSKKDSEVVVNYNRTQSDTYEDDTFIPNDLSIQTTNDVKPPMSPSFPTTPTKQSVPAILENTKSESSAVTFREDIRFPK